MIKINVEFINCSFPGGLKEDGDKDVTETALREMNEEIGVNPKDVDVWGKLIPLPNRVSVWEILIIINININF